jgi:predicted porin
MLLGSLNEEAASCIGSLVPTGEDGFELNTGKLDQSGAEFGRQAFVGLSSNRFGTVTLGRQYAGAVDYLGGFEFGGSDVGTRPVRT